jgi:hypothetical protein
MTLYKNMNYVFYTNAPAKPAKLASLMTQHADIMQAAVALTMISHSDIGYATIEMAPTTDSITT